MNVPQQQQQINLEQQPLEVLYKLFRQRINIAEQFQRDLDGAKRDVALINMTIQKREEAEIIKKQAQEKPPEPETGKPEDKPVKKKETKKKDK